MSKAWRGVFERRSSEHDSGDQGFDRLWAPWRSTYVVHPPTSRTRCIFCLAKRSRNRRKAHVVAQGTYVFCLLNRYPYNAGHLMIAAYRHIGTLAQLTPEESSELLHMTTRMIGLLTKVLKPHGFNVGLNVGRVAGAGIPGHLHLHVVPRWAGDTNFMPVIGSTKVVSESLDALYDRLNAGRHPHPGRTSDAQRSHRR